jgi:cytochrome c oxidase subunit 3
MAGRDEAVSVAGRDRLTASVLGMALFLASEVMFFGALFGAYYTIRSRAGAWPPAGTPELGLVLPGILTAVLLTSSVTQHLADRAAHDHRERALGRWLWLTILLGAGFLAGEAWEWRELSSEGFSVSSNAFGTLFFTITGFHGLHLLGGLVVLVLALKKARSAAEPVHRAGAMTAATLYWHFVDAVWIFVALTVYVVPMLG